MAVSEAEKKAETIINRTKIEKSMLSGIWFMVAVYYGFFWVQGWTAKVGGRGVRDKGLVFMNGC